MAKQCSEEITDGEKTQEQISLPSDSQHFSIDLPCYQGLIPTGWLQIPLAQKSKNKLNFMPSVFPAYEGLFADQDR